MTVQHIELEATAEAGRLPRAERWFRSPTLLRNDDLELIGELDPDIDSPVRELAQSILDRIEGEFRRNGCTVHLWDGDRLPQSPERAVVLNPVFVGKLPEAALAAFHRGTVNEYKQALRETLPEVFARAIQIGRRMGLRPTPHPNFVNIILLDDSDRELRDLSFERKVIFLRMMMTKVGGFKNVIVPYVRRKNRVDYDRVILSTLEGGQPVLAPEEVARRLMIFGSTRSVGGWSKSEEYSIATDDWRRSPAVRGLIALGNFLGRKRLLAEPILIRDLVRDAKLADTIIGLLNYSRQAEGAFWAIDHDLPYRDRSMPWSSTGVFPLVTVSGRYGTKKTELTHEDIVPVVPTAEGTVEVVQVGSNDSRGPSVEAEEFTLPLREMPPIRVAEIHGRLQVVSEGGIEVPPVRAGVHLHRGFANPKSERVVVVPTDVAEYPPVGCGVDLMHEMSSYAMQRAVQLWESSGRRAAAAVFYVPNHGVNVFLFWTANRDGVIPADPFALFEELVEEEELLFETDIPQV
ncbi:MAG: hypothetical protein M3068_08415 [Gemmatimonadota bacterium]|nr:hypothetical protein [Gemmatimonadota bacterium]